MREGEKKLGGGGVVDVCLGREEKGSVYICLFMSPGCVFRRVVDKQTKSKF